MEAASDSRGKPSGFSDGRGGEFNTVGTHSSSSACSSPRLMHPPSSANLAAPVPTDDTEHFSLLRKFEIIGTNQHSRRLAVLLYLHAFMPMAGTAHSISGTVREVPGF